MATFNLLKMYYMHIIRALLLSVKQILNHYKDVHKNILILFEILFLVIVVSNCNFDYYDMHYSCFKNL